MKRLGDENRIKWVELLSKQEPKLAILRFLTDIPDAYWKILDVGKKKES